MSEFKFEKTFAGDVLILRPEGYFNEQAGQALRAFIKECPAEKTRKVVLNLEKVAVINSPGITQILEITEDILYLDCTTWLENMNSPAFSKYDRTFL